METIFDYFGGSTFLLFKSYYVVWKPNLGRIIPIAIGIGLNRTMQYGNEEGIWGMGNRQGV